MSNIGRDQNETEKLKYERLLQMIMDDMRYSTVYLLVGKADPVKSWLMLKVAIEMLKNGATSRIVYIKAPFAIFFGHLTVKDYSNVSFIPEFWQMYQWLFQEVGEEQTKTWLSSGMFQVHTTDDYADAIENADVILLDEIQDMNSEMVHQIIEDHKANQKILMTYQSVNAVFTDLMINEFESLVQRKKHIGAFGYRLVDNQVIDDLMLRSLPCVPDLFKHLMVSEIELEVMDHNQIRHLIFNVKNKQLELIDTSESVTPILISEAIVTKKEPVIIEEPKVFEKPETKEVTEKAEDQVVFISDFWGKCVDFNIKALMASGENGHEIVDDAIEYQEIVMEKVSSDYWGTYKVHALKAIVRYEPEENEWRNFKTELSAEEEDQNKTIRLTIESQNKYLIGKVAGTNLLDSNQNIIVRKGEVITAEIIEKVTLSNLLVELIINMTLPELEGTYE